MQTQPLADSESWVNARQSCININIVSTHMYSRHVHACQSSAWVQAREGAESYVWRWKTLHTCAASVIPLLCCSWVLGLRTHDNAHLDERTVWVAHWQQSMHGKCNTPWLDCFKGRKLIQGMTQISLCKFKTHVKCSAARHHDWQLSSLQALSCKCGAKIRAECMLNKMAIHFDRRTSLTACSYADQI